jgi:hypothetical protein
MPPLPFLLPVTLIAITIALATLALFIAAIINVQRFLNKLPLFSIP